MDREVHAIQRRVKDPAFARGFGGQVNAPHLARLRAEVLAFAAALRAGQRAARIMWRRSRDPRARGPNERMIERDADRLREWQLWIRRANRNPDIIWQATPVCGAWQLQFTVHNFAPALQKVAVEQRQTDGSWQTLHQLHTIEFRAFAARPRTRINREFSVPVAAPPQMVGRVGLPYPAAAIGLRLAVRGVGRIAISRVELTDGVVCLRPAGWPPRQRKILGRPAPTRGFPAVSYERNVAAIEVGFGS